MAVKLVGIGPAVFLGVLAWTGCQPALPGSPKPLSAGALSEEYERSTAAVRSKYEGKEISVRGYTTTAAKMPRDDAAEGTVLLQEKGQNNLRQVACWFSREQATEFSKLRGGQSVTVAGVFAGEVGIDLKFCKLVKAE